MRAHRTFLAGSLLLATVLVAPLANAGKTAPISTLSSMSKLTPLHTPEAITALPGVSMKSKDGYNSTRWHDINAATGRGYCLMTWEGGAPLRDERAYDRIELFGSVR